MSEFASMTEFKYCKNCKHCQPNWWISIISFGVIDLYEFSKCLRPDPENPDLVKGKRKVKYCDHERLNFFATDVCGEEAKYYEHKSR